MKTIIISLAANSANHLQNYVFFVSTLCNKARLQDTTVTRNRLGSCTWTYTVVQQNPNDLRYLLPVRRPAKNISKHAELLVVAFSRNPYYT